MLVKFTTSVLAALLLADQKKTLALAHHHEEILEQNREEVLYKINDTNHLHQVLPHEGELIARSGGSS
jgi:hypothetical protein